MTQLYNPKIEWDQERSTYECKGRFRYKSGYVQACKLGDHEEAHRSNYFSWYDDQDGAFYVPQQPKDRVEFEGGGMRDAQNGKPRFDLLCPERVPYESQYLTRVAKLMGRGAEHYEDRNWEKFADQNALDRARASAFRHFMQWFNGETDEDHAAAVFFNIQATEYVRGRLDGEW